MEEAESLCDNIVIMINGRFVVMGSPGYLKDQYGSGYVIMLQSILPEALIDEYLQQNFNGILEKKGSMPMDEVHEGYELVELEFQVIAGSNMKLSTLFDQLIMMKEQHKLLKEFTVTRSSLEQVFIQFAKHQIEQPNFDEMDAKAKV